MYALGSLHRQNCESKEGALLTSLHRFLQVFDRLLLTFEARVLGVVQPAELLKHLGVVGIAFEDPMIRGLCIFKLSQSQHQNDGQAWLW